MGINKFINFLGLLLLLELAAAATLIPREQVDMGPAFEEPVEIPRNSDNLPPRGAETVTVSKEIIDWLQKFHTPYTISSQENGLTRNITYTLNPDGTIDIRETGDIWLDDLVKNPGLIPAVGDVSIKELLESDGKPIPKSFKGNNVEQHAVYKLYGSGNGNRVEQPTSRPQVPARAPQASAQTPQGIPRGTSSGMQTTYSNLMPSNTIFSTSVKQDCPTYNSASYTPHSPGNGFAIPTFNLFQLWPQQFTAVLNNMNREFARDLNQWIATPTHLLMHGTTKNIGNPQSPVSQALTNPAALHYITLSRMFF